MSLAVHLRGVVERWAAGSPDTWLVRKAHGFVPHAKRTVHAGSRRAVVPAEDNHVAASPVVNTSLGGWAAPLAGTMRSARVDALTSRRATPFWLWCHRRRGRGQLLTHRRRDVIVRPCPTYEASAGCWSVSGRAWWRNVAAQQSIPPTATAWTAWIHVSSSYSWDESECVKRCAELEGGWSLATAAVGGRRRAGPSFDALGVSRALRTWQRP